MLVQPPLVVTTALFKSFISQISVLISKNVCTVHQLTFYRIDSLYQPASVAQTYRQSESRTWTHNSRTSTLWLLRINVATCLPGKNDATDISKIIQQLPFPPQHNLKSRLVPYIFNLWETRWRCEDWWGLSSVNLGWVGPDLPPSGWIFIPPGAGKSGTSVQLLAVKMNFYFLNKWEKETQKMRCLMFPLNRLDHVISKKQKSPLRQQRIENGSMENPSAWLGSDKRPRHHGIC